ncbi:MAG: DUF1577 domain-containing protein [Spirochaetes bacterium]|nr:DUF1577 domain-containing protein [Spirochaetota bacterium]
MLNINQRKDRSFIDPDANSKEEVFEYVKNSFKNKPLLIKYSSELGEVKINEFLNDRTIMVVTDPDFRPETNFTLYGLMDKYIEIDLIIEETRGPGYFKCRIDKLKRAAVSRKEIRFKLSPEEVIATNFKISKHTIDITNYSIPTSIKVLLEQFESSNSGLSDIVKVSLFEDEDAILKHIRKTGETLFVENIADEESYLPFSDDFVNAKELLGYELHNFIKKNIEKGYKSIIISPVIYLTNPENSIPFAYIQLISKSEHFTIENVLEIKGLIFTLIDRIRDANTIMVQVHQEITDISKTGAKLKITDQNLKKYMIRARGFIFDIVFRLQAPITIYGDIKSTYTDNSGDMYVGVDFAGNSSRQDEMKRFYAMLDPMIKEYKNKLIREIKAGKK